MRQPSTSPRPPPNARSPPHWDSKCRHCCQFMSRCTCFRESDTDDPLDAGNARDVRADAAHTRPLWNALRKMHPTSTATYQSLVELATSSHSSGSRLFQDHPCTRREAALPSLTAITSVASASTLWHHVEKRSDTQLSLSSRHDWRKPRDGPLLGHPLPCNDGLQRAGISSSSRSVKRDVNDVGAMRSVQSTCRFDKPNFIGASRYKENLSCGWEDGRGLGDDYDGTVWEL